MKHPAPPKTNAVRLLDARRIPYELRTYPVDENDLSGTTVADHVGLPYSQVFKTLVVKGDRTGHLAVLIPVDRELDKKALAAATGNKSLDLIPVKDLQPLTGYVRGGCSPIGMKKPLPVYLHASAFDWPTIAMSAGVRGCQMLIAPGDLAKVVNVVTWEGTLTSGV